MPTEKEIKSKYQKLHDKLSSSFYAGTSGLTKEQFDLQHGQIWADMEAELIAGGFITPPTPPRDLEAEIDAIKARIEKLEKGIGQARII